MATVWASRRGHIAARTIILISKVVAGNSPMPRYR